MSGGKNTGRSSDAERICHKLQSYSRELHSRNKRRIRNGFITMFALPAGISVLLALTGSSKISFLLVWVLSMFVVAAFLIIIAFIDAELQKMIADVTGEKDPQIGSLFYSIPEVLHKKEDGTDK